eukprot:3107293-Alexandrium_andersonii.AAC.1
MGKVGDTPPPVGPPPKSPLGVGTGGALPASAAKCWKVLTARPRRLFSTGICIVGNCTGADCAAAGARCMAAKASSSAADGGRTRLG